MYSDRSACTGKYTGRSAVEFVVFGMVNSCRSEVLLIVVVSTCVTSYVESNIYACGDNGQVAVWIRKQGHT